MHYDSKIINDNDNHFDDNTIIPSYKQEQLPTLKVPPPSLLLLLEWLDDKEKICDIWDWLLLFAKSSPERKIIFVTILLCIGFSIIIIIKRTRIF